MASSIERRPEIRGVGVLQVGYMGAVGGLLMAIVFGAIMAIVVVATGAAGSGAPVGQSLAGGAIGFACMALMYPVFGFIGGCIYGLLYNLAGAITGGLEVEVR